MGKESDPGAGAGSTQAVSLLPDLATLLVTPPLGAPAITSISRRGFIAAGAATVATLAVPVAAALAVQRAFDQLGWRRDASVIELLADGRPIWRLDTRAFAGAPRITLAQSRDALSLSMTGSRYAGTRIRANLALALTREQGQWRLRVRHALLGDAAPIDLGEWLRGERAWRAPLARPLALNAGRQARWRQRAGTAQLHPDLALSMGAGHHGNLKLHGGARLSTHAVRWTPRLHDASGMQVPATGVDFDTACGGPAAHPVPLSGSMATLSPALAMQGSWLSLETTDQRVESRLIMQPSAASGALSLAPVKRLANRLPRLQLPAFALVAEHGVAMDGIRLLATAGLEGEWFSGPDLSWQLQAKPGATLATNVPAGGQRCEGSGLTVAAVRVPLPGFDYAELVPERCSTLTIPDAVSCLQGKICLNLDLLRLDAVRARDLVELSFTFFGYELVIDAGKAHLRAHRRDDRAAQVRVHLPPQSIGEQAYFVQDNPPPAQDSIHVDEPKWADALKRAVDECKPEHNKDPKACLIDYLAQTNEFITRDRKNLIPQATAAGQSRLVFEPAARRIDWSFDGLMAWRHWPMRLVNRAAPTDLSTREQLELAKNPLLQPALGETAIEIPFRVLLSPIPRVRQGNEKIPPALLAWRMPAPAKDDLPVPLWHAMLPRHALRAIWSHDLVPGAYARRLWLGNECGDANAELQDPPPNHNPAEPRRSMSARDRHELVGLTSVYGMPAKAGTIGVIPPVPGMACGDGDGGHITGHFFTPSPLAADLLALSSFGGYLRGRGHWEPPHVSGGMVSPSIEHWRFSIPWGREDLQRIEYKGFLFPLGIRVKLVKLTERKFIRDPQDNEIKAVLLQRFFIQMPNAPKVFPGIEQPFLGQECELTEVRMLEPCTPDLCDPNVAMPDGQAGNWLLPASDQAPKLSDLGQAAFWPRTNAYERYSFRYSALDRAGHRTQRESPLIFVGHAVADNPALINKLVDYYNSLDGQLHQPLDGQVQGVYGRLKSARTVIVTGSRVGYAPRAARQDSDVDTAFLTRELVLKAVTNGSGPYGTGDAAGSRLPEMSEAMISASQPPFYPAVHYANVEIPAIARMSPGAAPSTCIGYFRTYVEHGFDPEHNSNEVFAVIDTRQKVVLDVSSDGSSVGGVASPNNQAVALSRRLGLVGGRGSAPASAAGTRALLAASKVEVSASADLDKLAQGTFDPASYFGGALSDAKLLGTIRLMDVLRVVMGRVDQMPKFIEETKYQADERCEQLLLDAAEMLKAIEQRVRTAAAAAPGLLPLSDKLASLRAKVGEPESVCSADSVQKSASLAGLASAGKDLIQELRRIGSDPVGLLPADAARLVQTLREAVQCVLPPHAGCVAFAAPISTLIQALKSFSETQLKALESQVASQLPEGLPRWWALQLLDDLRLLWDEYVREGGSAEQVSDRANALLRARLLQLQDGLLRLARRAAIATCEDAVEEPLAVLARLHASIHADVQNGIHTLRKQVATLDDQLRALWATYVLHAVDIPADVTSAVRVFQHAIQSAQQDLINCIERLTAFSDVLNTPLEKAAVCGVSSQESGAFLLLTSSDARVGLQAHLTLQAELLRAGNALQTLAQVLDCHLAQPGQLSELGQRIVEASELDAGFRQAWTNLRTQLGKCLGSLESLLQEPVGGLATTIDALTQWFTQNAQVVSTFKHDVAQLQQQYKALRDLPADALQSLRAIALARALKSAEQVISPLVQTVMDALIPQAVTLYQNLVTQACALWGRAAPPLRQVASRLENLSGDAVTAAENAAKWISPGVIAQVKQVNTVSASAASKLALATCTQPQELITVQTGVDDLQTAIRLLTKLADEVIDSLSRGEVARLIDASALADEIEQALREIIPSLYVYKFDWNTRLSPFPSGAPVFVPGGAENHLTLLSRIEVPVPLQGNAKPRTELSGTVRDFTLDLMPGLPLCSITFNEVSFKSTNGAAPTYHVDIRAVEMGAAFQFIEALKNYLCPGKGPYIALELSPPAIVVGFFIGRDLMQFGGFLLQNVNLDIRFRLPFNNTPATFRFRFADPVKPFGMSCGIYGGGGYLDLIATPSKMLSVEGAFEFGAMTAIQFGPLRASGRVVAGIDFRIGGEGTAISGYVLATGSGTLGWFSVNVLLMVRVTSNGSRVTGQATYSISFEIGKFATITFKFTAKYGFTGGGAKQSRLSGTRTDHAALAAGRTADVKGKRPSRDEIAKQKEAINKAWKRRRNSYRPLD